MVPSTSVPADHPTFTPGTEITQPAFPPRPIPKITYGLPFHQACAKHITSAFAATRIYIIASKSLSLNKTHPALQTLREALGDKVVGVRIGISSHTPIPEIVDVLDEVRGLDVDCIVTLGAGSITDGAKLVRFALANAAFEEEEIDTLWGNEKSPNPRQRRDVVRSPQIPLICVPTSLSGGEYQALAGATDAKTHAKRPFYTGADPELVVQDPELCGTTPKWVWVSSGVRAVDHCIETLCSLLSNPEVDQWARRGLLKLVPGLLRSQRMDGDDEIAARHLCQVGVMEAMCAVSAGVPLGASHAIGHQLGPLGVGHGETSCILLPAVCKFNAAKKANVGRQREVVGVLVGDAEVEMLLERKGIDAGEVDLGDLLDVVIRELGMPRSLKDVNVGREKLHELAVNSLQDQWIKTNPVAITTEERVMEILEMVSE